ncbi:hypothetical protein SAMN02745244_03264 [Tessaracoccus bendigoensis DSM 12906]|uniref:Uncharacterized protein n=1 Tax=Tessaracoccus bendigoensis DSM 12906 TaxID=1123357 RepID=A0A1M6M6X0_9ACTN|nr:hypothetical protein SAMN02745244_03264 [Tessaracoccus bendigoensis DSM 12906]
MVSTRAGAAALLRRGSTSASVEPPGEGRARRVETTPRLVQQPDHRFLRDSAGTSRWFRHALASLRSFGGAPPARRLSRLVRRLSRLVRDERGVGVTTWHTVQQPDHNILKDSAETSRWFRHGPRRSARRDRLNRRVGPAQPALRLSRLVRNEPGVVVTTWRPVQQPDHSFLRDSAGTSRWFRHGPRRFARRDRLNRRAPGSTDARPAQPTRKPGSTDAQPGSTDAQPGSTDAQPGSADGWLSRPSLVRYSQPFSVAICNASARFLAASFPMAELR